MTNPIMTVMMVIMERIPQAIQRIGTAAAAAAVDRSLCIVVSPVTAGTASGPSD